MVSVSNEANIVFIFTEHFTPFANSMPRDGRGLVLGSQYQEVWRSAFYDRESTGSQARKFLVISQQGLTCVQNDSYYRGGLLGELHPWNADLKDSNMIAVRLATLDDAEVVERQTASVQHVHNESLALYLQTAVRRLASTTGTGCTR